MIHGIDVSAYQSETYSTSGLDFVFTKITEGLSYINPRWVAQRDRAKAAGLVWGAYHYPHMANDPKAEATYFLKQVAWKPGDLIVLDWEGYDTANKAVPKAQQIAYRDAWLKYVKSVIPDHRVGMYCNTDYWRNVDQTSTCGDFLWIATGGEPAGQPGIDYGWTFHQYSTANNIDHDVANFPDRAALAAWASNTQEDPVALTSDDISKVADAVFAKLAAGGGVLENSDLDRIWGDDVIPAAVPPYNNSDYYGPDGKTVANSTWTAKYTQYTQVMVGRETLARVKNLETATGAVQMTDAQVAALANQVAASTNLVDLIAEKVAEKIATRLAE
ncbi:glycoside hydrolase family 25 protein [Streptomyces natalensis]|uniref:glycoside hydrolase family 25 protein n=1 Tax=Streptomyces natalensis TaxID=68242 RepID=UPI0007C491FE|nr:glycoside hydrolase family 25 protein [Streptomyces natalensis]